MWEKYPEIHDELKKVEVIIKENIKSRNKLLTEVCRELVLAGGKRLRPAFVIISSKFGEYNGEKATTLAGALEILHTATLVHDDVIDRSKLRRGKETVSERYGIDMAIYTGDFLFTKALMLLTSYKGIDLKGIEKPEIAAKAIKMICEGEVDQYQQRFDPGITTFTYLKRICRKTAVLFAAACSMGAWSAGCPEDTVRILGKFGMYYGMAFQIRDDLIDFVSDSKKEGKPVIKDINEGVITLPVIYAISKDYHIRDIIKRISADEISLASRDMKDVLHIVNRSGGIEYSRKMLDKYIARGLKEIRKLPSNKYTDIFSELIQSLRIN